MSIRQLTFLDINPTSRILAAAFFDDSLVGDYIHPYREQHPDGVRLFQRQGLRSTYYSGPDHVHLVTHDEANMRQITGYAHWIRKRAAPRPQTLYQRVMSIVISVYNYIEGTILPDRALEPSRTGIFDELDRLMKHHLVGHRQECWYLALLGVDPQAHKSGQGRQLLSWGLDRGREEEIPVGLISSVAGEGFYRHCGFKVELGRIGSWLGDKNPLKDVAGGEVFFTE